MVAILDENQGHWIWYLKGLSKDHSTIVWSLSAKQFQKTLLNIFFIDSDDMRREENVGTILPFILGQHNEVHTADNYHLLLLRN